MFSGYLRDAWLSAAIVAVVCGAVGFFVVMRASTFAAHAIPQAGVPGAAGASLLGVDPHWGVAVTAPLMALVIAVLAARRRAEVAVAMTLVLFLAVGYLFIDFNSQYAPVAEQLLFGEVLGVASSQIVLTAIFGIVALAILVAIYRPLLSVSVLPEMAEARGLRDRTVGPLFLLTVALAATVSAQVVGTLIVFTLMVGPPAAARRLCASPGRALAVSALLAVAVAWGAIALSYVFDWPVGFPVGIGSAAVYLVSKAPFLAARGPTVR